jgi:hypothetical protein
MKFLPTKRFTFLPQHFFPSTPTANGLETDPGEEPTDRDLRQAYVNAAYVQPRLAALFQQKIGIATDTRSVHQLALLGSLRILNHYHFSEIELPVCGDLKLRDTDGPAEAVLKAERNFDDLLVMMRKFQKYLQTDVTDFHEAEASLVRYLVVLDEPTTQAE